MNNSHQRKQGARMRFYKYHALGNDYIIIDPSENGNCELTPSQIQLICHRNFGVGSDGILWGPLESADCDYALRIYNPDGSEAEKSGNGLRIFSRYLWDKALIGNKPFTIHTPGGKVQSRIRENGRLISVDMGRVSFDSRLIPVSGVTGDVINQKMTVNGKELSYCAATVGNPHCVILQDEISPEETRSLGPLIETDLRFPNRTNVQFLKILDHNNIQLEIWERGAGYTLASGSSSSAAAAVAFKLGLCDSRMTVHMPGGKLDITVSDDYFISMTGPVTRIAEGILFPEMFAHPL